MNDADHVFMYFSCLTYIISSAVFLVGTQGP